MRAYVRACVHVLCVCVCKFAHIPQSECGSQRHTQVLVSASYLAQDRTSVVFSILPRQASWAANVQEFSCSVFHVFIGTLGDLCHMSSFMSSGGSNSNAHTAASRTLLAGLSPQAHFFPLRCINKENKDTEDLLSAGLEEQSLKTASLLERVPN